MRSGDVSAALMMHAHVTEFQPFVRKKQHLPTNGGRCRTLTRPSSYIILILQTKKKGNYVDCLSSIFLSLLFSWILLTLCLCVKGVKCSQYLLFIGTIGGT